MNRSITFTVYPDLQSTHGVRQTMTVAEMLHELTDFEGCERPPKPAPWALWHPATFEADHATKANAIEAFGVVLDLDWDTDSEARLKRLSDAIETSGWAYVLHETFTRGRWRLVVPLSEPCPALAYADVWNALREALGLSRDDVDTTAEGVQQRFFMPCYPKGEHRRATTGGSELLDYKALLSGRNHSSQANPPKLLSSANPQESLSSSNIKGLAKPSESLSSSNIKGLAKPSESLGQANPTKLVKPKPQDENHPENFLASETASNETPEKFSIGQEAASLDMNAIVASIKKLKKDDTREHLLLACEHKLVMTEGAREQPLNKMVFTFTKFIEVGNSWPAVQTFFGSVIDRMVPCEPARYWKVVQKGWKDGLASREEFETEKAQRALAGKILERRIMGMTDDGEQVEGEEWRSGLSVNSQGLPRSSLNNICLVLENDPEFRGFIKFNELTRSVEVFGGYLAMENEQGDRVFAGSNPSALSRWLEVNLKMSVTRDDAGSALLFVAKLNRFNPVRTYLDALVWDGVPRIRRMLSDYFQAEGNTGYVESISKNFFVGAVARALDPGCQVDASLMLRGGQGIRKTTFVRVISRGWYTDFNNQVNNKDSIAAATESWVVELGEMSMVSKNNIAQVRNFLTVRKDRIRLPYTAAYEDYSRRCVFVGTTNDDTPLHDQDGNRRFWVVSVGELDILRLEKDLDQLWAEAVAYYREYKASGMEGVVPDKRPHRWWFTRDEQVLSDEENQVFLEEDSYEHTVKVWARDFKFEKPMSLNEIARLSLAKAGVSIRDFERENATARVAKILKKIGWKGGQRRIGRGMREYVWSPPAETSEEDNSITVTPPEKETP